MALTERLSLEISIILLFHMPAVLLVFGFSVMMLLKSRRTPLLHAYLSAVSMLLIWMVSKICKTVSPTLPLRWFFVVIQYVGVQFLGVLLLRFSHLYSRGRPFSRKTQCLLFLPPALSFLAVATNPWHMAFYSYFDMYRDRFGPLFLPTQLMAYGYLVVSVLLLTRGFSSQPGFHGKKRWAWLTAGVILVPLLANLYYILFKLLDGIPWIFPFPVFDFTPIAGSLSLVLFMIPALRYRFFDIAPVTYRQWFEQMPDAVVRIGPDHMLHGANPSFTSRFGPLPAPTRIPEWIERLPATTAEKNALAEWMNASVPEAFTLRLARHRQGQTCYRVSRSGPSWIRFADITDIVRAVEREREISRELMDIRGQLQEQQASLQALAAVRTKTQVAQHVHDILGHSLTVVLGTAELAMRATSPEMARARLDSMDELLANGLEDLRNAILGRLEGWGQTSLLKHMSRLSSDRLKVELTVQGTVRELTAAQTEAIYRLCLEAVTNAIRHGHADTLHLILRFKTQTVELYAMDDGMGCADIRQNMGLGGIRSRMEALGGNVRFASDGKHGFTIFAELPVNG